MERVMQLALGVLPSVCTTSSPRCFVPYEPLLGSGAECRLWFIKKCYTQMHIEVNTEALARVEVSVAEPAGQFLISSPKDLVTQPQSFHHPSILYEIVSDMVVL